MGASVKLTDPNHCRVCGHVGRIKHSRPVTQWRRRRHHCSNPKCGYRWTSYQLMVNPRRLRPATAPRPPKPSSE